MTDERSAFQILLEQLGNSQAEEDFREELQALEQHPVLARHLSGGEVDFSSMTVSEVAELAGKQNSVGYYFLIGAANLDRTQVKTGRQAVPPEVLSKHRMAHFLKDKLPAKESFSSVVARAAASRAITLRRAQSGGVEQMVRALFGQEGVDVVMSGDGYTVKIPGLLIKDRKPDGVYPDPREGRAPLIYLEVKNVKRVGDDIQKRLYEIAQASLEMKILYGNLELKGFGASLGDAAQHADLYRAELRKAITASRPVVVGLLLCSRAPAEQYRPRIEAFVDRVFFANDEMDECISFLRATIEQFNNLPGVE